MLAQQLRGTCRCALALGLGGDVGWGLLPELAAEQGDCRLGVDNPQRRCHKGYRRLVYVTFGR